MGIVGIVTMRTKATDGTTRASVGLSLGIRWIELRRMRGDLWRDA
jgi:hypothetical protein